MAGDFAITATFTKADIDTLTGAQLGVTVLVDLSHNSFTTTTDHPSGLQVISKPVELDIQVDKGTAAPADFFGLASVKTTSAAYQIYKWIADRGGLDRLNQSNVKVAAPKYDPAIVDHDNGALAAPLSAATAPTVADFNLLPDNVRRSMGMYRWNPAAKTYAFSGNAATAARTAP